MALFSLQDGGLLGEYQQAASGPPQPTAASAAFSRDGKALCAVAYPDCCIIVTSPWRQKPCAIKGQYVCPKVYTLFAHINSSCKMRTSARGDLFLQQVLLALELTRGVLLTCVMSMLSHVTIARMLCPGLSSKCCEWHADPPSLGASSVRGCISGFWTHGHSPVQQPHAAGAD